MEAMLGPGFDLLEKLFWYTMRLLWEVFRFALGMGHEAFKQRQANSLYVPSLLTAARVKPCQNPTQYSLRLPASAEWDSAQAYQLMSQLVGNFAGLCFRIVADKNGTMWQIVDYWNAIPQEALVNTIAAIYPEAEITAEAFRPAPYQKPTYRLLGKFWLGRMFPAPLPGITELKDLDPLMALTQGISELGEGERLIYTLAVVEPAQEAYRKGERLITVSTANIAYPASYATGERREIYKQELTNVMQKKLQNPLYHAFLLVEIDAPMPERATAMAAVIGNLGEFYKDGFNALVSHPDTVSDVYVNSEAVNRQNDTFALLNWWLGNDKHQLSHYYLMVLDPSELAALWHLPHKGFTATGIQRLRGKQLPLPRVMVGKREGVCLGVNRFRGALSEVYLPEEDRATHMTVIGQTGVGKSTFLHHLIHADIAQGRGVVVVDPKGHLVRDLLQTSIPESRETDLVVLDIANLINPPPFNLMAVPGDVDGRNAVNLLAAVFAKIYPDFAGRMVDTFSMALQTLLEAETPTLLDVERLFQDPDYQRQQVEASNDWVIAKFWQQFNAKSASQQDELAYPVVHRLRNLYGNRLMRRMTCHPNPLDYAQLVAENKIVLISLHLPESKLRYSERNLLGASLVSQIQMAAMGGAIQTPPVYLYIDEAQNFVTSALPQMLEAARGWGLSLVLANQHLKQLSGETLDAALGNVGATIAFQCRDHDASIIARTRQGFAADDLMHLDKYKAGVFMRYRGETQPAFSLETLPPLRPESPAKGAAREVYLREKSAAQYCPVTAAEIDAWLAARYGQPALDAADATMDEDFYDASVTDVQKT